VHRSALILRASIDSRALALSLRAGGTVSSLARRPSLSEADWGWPSRFFEEGQMKVLSRVAVAVSGLGVGALCLHLGYSSLNDLGGRGDVELTVSQEVIRGEQIEDGLSGSRSRQRAKQELVRDLIAQRRTLKDTMAQFIRLRREWYENHKNVEPFPSADSEEERAYEEILNLVPFVLHDQSEEGDAVRSRLKKEYEKLGDLRKCPLGVPGDP
jgi:hypothetical protein